MYEVNIRVIVFTVLAFSRRILKLGLKLRSFSKSAFPVLLKNVLTFIPRWLEGRVVVAQTTRWGGFQHEEPQHFQFQDFYHSREVWITS